MSQKYDRLERRIKGAQTLAGLADAIRSATGAARRRWITSGQYNRLAAAEYLRRQALIDAETQRYREGSNGAA